MQPPITQFQMYCSFSVENSHTCLFHTKLGNVSWD